MAEGRDAADGIAGECADIRRIGAAQCFAQDGGNARFIDTVAPRDEQKVGSPAFPAAKNQRFDDLRDIAATGEGGFFRRAGRLGMGPDLDGKPQGSSCIVDALGGGGQHHLTSGNHHAINGPNLIVRTRDAAHLHLDARAGARGVDTVEMPGGTVQGIAGDGGGRGDADDGDARAAGAGHMGQRTPVVVAMKYEVRAMAGQYLFKPDGVAQTAEQARTAAMGRVMDHHHRGVAGLLGEIETVTQPFQLCMTDAAIGEKGQGGDARTEPDQSDIIADAQIGKPFSPIVALHVVAQRVSAWRPASGAT
jgi:hypothetical protein